MSAEIGGKLSDGYYNKKGDFIFGPAPFKEQSRLEQRRKNEAHILASFDALDDINKVTDGLPTTDEGGEVDPSLLAAMGHPVGSSESTDELFARLMGDAVPSSSSSAMKRELPPMPDAPSDLEDSDDEETKKQKAAVLDDAFAALMGQLAAAPTRVQKVAKKKYLSPELLVEKIMAARSSFEIMQLTPGHTAKELKKTYYEISRLVHPDKCPHKDAHEAFQKLSEAHEELKSEQLADRYKDVWEKAKDIVTKRREAANEEKSTAGQTDFFDMEGHEFDNEVVSQCEDLLEGKKEDDRNVKVEQNKIAAANEERIRKRMAAEKKAEKAAKRQKTTFERGMDTRVAGWQTFVKNTAAGGNFETKGFSRVGQVAAADKWHKREEKTQQQKDREKEDRAQGKGAQQKAAGTEEEHKNSWR